VLPSGEKLTLGLLVIVSFEVISFCVYAKFPSLLPFFACILEVVFSEYQHRLLVRIEHLFYVKMAALLLFFQPRKQRKLGWLWDDSHVVFGQEFPGGKEL
jgi:hypothetical protein